METSLYMEIPLTSGFCLQLCALYCIPYTDYLPVMIFSSWFQSKKRLALPGFFCPVKVIIIIHLYQVNSCGNLANLGIFCRKNSSYYKMVFAENANK